MCEGTRYCSSLRRYATSLKVAVSSPDVIRLFFQLTSFERHYGPGIDSASERNEHQAFSWWVKGGWRVSLTNLPPCVSRLSRKCGNLYVLTTLCACTACCRDSCTFSPLGTFFSVIYYISSIEPSFAYEVGSSGDASDHYSGETWFESEASQEGFYIMQSVS
jgi:hypothetical protein